MAKGENRLKILYVLDILKQNSKKYGSDESGRFMSANQLSKELFDKHKLTSDRKSIYSYIKSLEDYGCEFEKTKGGCYLLSCPNDYSKYSFETAELKAIADTLVLSRFYPASKTKKTIKKLEHLLPNESISLKGENVFIDNAIKSDNQAVIYNIDNIFHAINQDKQISFSYYSIEVEFGANGNHFITKYRTENGKKKVYIQSPFHLLWKNDTYYLLTFDSATQKERTFRVDRMRDVIVQNGSDNTTDLRRDGKDYFSKIDVVEYANTIFDMFGGEKKNISLRVKKSLAKVIADKFGKKVSVYHDMYDDDDFFLCSVNVQQSKTFFSWLSNFGNDVQITYPADVRQDYVKYLKSILDGYDSLEMLEHQK